MQEWSTLKKLLFWAAARKQKRQETPAEGKKPDLRGNKREKAGIR